MAHPIHRSTVLFTALLVLAAALRPAPASAFTPAEATAPMTVTLVRSDAAGCGANCPEWLALTGAIGPGTPALFSAALARLGPRRVPVLVDSPGGAVEAALAMGRTIRARKLDVAVAGTMLTDCAAADQACATRRRAGERPGFVAGGIAACASACVLLLAAGTERSVGENSYVGVHQMIVHKTFTRVMNTFRVVRRMVGGRAVEVSRTLVATRPVSSRTVLAAAPEQLYSEVDRYLLAMGVAESIMPLMRSAPPSGVHWMTKPELAATRIATDATEAATLVMRAAAPASAGTPASAMAVASVRVDDGPRALGIVDWRVDRAAPHGPTLVGAIAVPERHLRGTVTIRRAIGIGEGDGFTATVDLGSPTALEAGSAWTAQALRLCDTSVCSTPFTAAAARDDGTGTGEFGVIRRWGDVFLSYLRDRDALNIDLTSPDGRHGAVALSLTGGARGIVDAWEHLCCGLAAPADTGTTATPSTSGPPLASALQPQWTETRVAYTLDDAAGGATPRDGVTTLTWMPLPHSAAPDDRPALIGTLEMPAVGLHLSLQAGPVGPVGAQDVAIDVSPIQDPARFGPIANLAVPPVWGPDGHVVLFADRIIPVQYGGGYRVVLAPTADLPEVAEISLEMTDASGRRITATVPIDGPLRALLRTVRAAQGTG